MHEILKYLRTHGELLDTEIALALGMPLAKAQQQLAKLAADGEIITCHTVRFDKGKKVEGTICRLSGHMPKASPGRKSKVQLS
jgi:transcription initiation factor IIE alpha subunit